MIRKRTKLLLSFFIILLAGGLLYYLFSMQNQLPVIKKIENIKLDSVLTDDYNLHNKKIKIVAFMFTKCPDICPMTMVDLSRLQTELKKTDLFQNEVQIVTITLDPEFDTEKVLKNYSERFDVDPNGWFMQRGTITETEDAAKQFQMTYQRDENGMITHGTNMYLVDGNDRIRAVHEMNIMGEPVDLEAMMENIKRLTKE
ncbi:SCO family protein [Virgibacillus oceani]